MAREGFGLLSDSAKDDEAPANGTTLPLTVLVAQTPKGFEDLAEPVPAVVDVYFGGTLIGTTSGVQEPGHFTFDDPGEVVGLIPDIIDRALVVQALSGKLDGHNGLVCGASPRPGCGEVAPPVAAIIYDAAMFRLDVFIASDHLAVRGIADNPYLPTPDAGLSFISNFSGSLNGTEGRAANYTIQNRSIVAWRNARLTAETAQTSDFGFEAQILSAEVDTNALRYRGGLFWSEPLAFTGQARVYGASIASQFDTLAGGDAAYSRPLVVFLARRAQVNAYRDGRLISSGLYEPGNQQIDTANFPTGAYNVVLEVVDNGSKREEIHFFTKDRTLPPPGKTAFSLTAGVLAHDRRAALPEFSDQLFAQATIAYRLADNIALESGALLLDSDFVAEVGTTYLGDGHTARIAGLAGNQGNYGAIAEFAWFDLRNFSINAYARRTWGPGLGGIDTGDRIGITPVNNVNFLVGDSRQVGGNVGVRLGNTNFRLSGFYYKIAREKSYYAFGPSVDYAWRGGANTQWTLFADGRRSSSDGWDARIGIRLNFNQNNFGIFNEVGGAYRKAGGAEQSDVVGSILATYSTPDVLEGDLSVAAGYARDLDSERVRGEAALDGQYGRFVGQVEHAFDTPDGGTRYSANFSTSIAVGGGEATIGGRQIGESGIMVALSGGNPDLQVDVLVNDSPRARIRPGQAVPIFLQAYRSYNVRLAPVDGAAGRFDTSARKVTLYAGNMAALNWTAEQVQAIFGRLVDANGNPVGNAMLGGGRDIIQTDANGYFQGEVSTGEEFVVRRAGNEICRLTIPPLGSSATLHRLGDVSCRP